MRRNSRLWIKLFTLLMMLSLMIGCTSNSGKEIAPEFTRIDSEDFNFDGYEFVYLLNDAEDDDIFLTYEIGSIMGDAAMKRISDLEKKYNFVFKQRSTSDTNSTLQTAIATNDTTISAAQWSTYNDNLQNLVRGGFFYPINELDNIDYKDETKWGNKYLREGVCWNNNTYGLIPAAWPEFNLSYAEFIFAVNMDYVRTLGLTDPREYIETETWTRAKLEESVKDYTHDLISGERVYGLTTNQYHFIVSVINAGVDDLLHKENGEYKYSVYTQQGIDAISWGNDFLYKNCVDYILPDTTSTEGIIQAFIDKKAVMINMTSSYIFQSTKTFMSDSISYSDIPFAIMPFPKADNSSAKDWKVLFEMLRHCITIPVNTYEPEAVAYILNKIYEPLEGFETEEKIKDYYLRNVFHDERDYNLFNEMITTSRYIFRGEGLGTFYADLGLNKPVSEVLEQYEEITKTILDDYIINIRSSFETLFG